jgi:soluble cytochrome b562
MDKEKLLKWIDESINSLEKEQKHNEVEHKNGDFPHWKSKAESGLHDILDNWWGYQSLIFQLDNIKKLINKGNFD